jgi:hypothetical protein
VGSSLKNLLISTITVLCLWCPALPADTQSDILAALDYYSEMWNDGDFDALASYYHKDFVLVTDDGPIASRERVSDLKRIAEGDGDAGRMTIDSVIVKELGEANALAFGQISLAFEDGSALSAWFTTIYLKTPFGWKAMLTRN